MQAISLNSNQLISNETLLLNHREIDLSNSSRLFLTSGYAPQGIFLEKKTTFSVHQASFNFCLKGKQFFTLTGNYLPTEADPRQNNTLLLPNETFTAQTETTGAFSTVTLHYDLEAYLKLLGDGADMLPKNFQTAAEKQNLCYFKNRDWPPRLKQILMQVQTENFGSPVAEKIFLESKMLEIIAIMLEMGHRQTAQQQFISKRDEEKIHYARAILERDLVNPPSLTQLARLIGSNEFTLKKGFKAIFGAPVYHFLQQLRMDKAQDLLLNTDQQVSEVAMTVGYDNLSAFTRAFRQSHGILPSEMRKTPFRHI